MGVRYSSCTNESVLPSQHDNLPVPISFIHLGGEEQCGLRVLLRDSTQWARAADNRSKFSKLFQKFQNSFFYHIWIQHEKCIQMSTNKPSIGALILEIASDFDNLKGHWTIFWNFIFGWISFIMWNATANLRIQKEKFRNSFWKLRNHQFLLNILKVGMRLICIHVAD